MAAGCATVATHEGPLPEVGVDARRIADLKRAKEAVKELGTVLCLFQEEGLGKVGHGVEDILRIVVDVRNLCRSNKQWELADTIRDRLAELGIHLEDRSDGTTCWKIKTMK